MFAQGNVSFPPPAMEEKLTIEAPEASRWRQGEHDVWRLAGGVRLGQGKTAWRSSEAILWIKQSNSFDKPTLVTAHLEGADGQPVRLELFSTSGGEKPIASQQSSYWFGSLSTTGGIEWKTPPPKGEPNTKPGIYARGLARFAIDSAQSAAQEERMKDGSVQPAQFASPFETVAPPPDQTPVNVGIRSVQVTPRQGAGLQFEGLSTPSGESVGVWSGGANLVITGIEGSQVPTGFGFTGAVDRIDLETDRAVLWTSGGEVLSTGQFQQSGETPLEVYLEGNIVFRQGERTIYAERMYYDVRRQTGVILDAELLTPAPEVDGFEYRGLVRLKADAIRQLDDSRFVADRALVTTSRLEEPSYSLRADRVAFEDYQRPLIDPATGEQAFDPFTGEPQYDRRQLAQSQGNRIFLGDLPVLYWPSISTDLTEPYYYITNFRVRNDTVFGFQVLADFDAYQLLGTPAPAGVDWDVGIDYLSERGVGFGTLYDYNIDRFAGAEGPATGELDLWFINDSGKDNLGFGRRGIDPEESFRGRAYWSHRQKVREGLLAGWTTQAQVGWISDRTFLEQYYEQDWDERGDQATGFRFRRLIDNQSLTVEANVRLNEFFTETQWLPRLDHYVMGQDLAGERLTWFAHSHVGYADQKSASTAVFDPRPLFDWEVPVEGERVATRHEIDLPIDLEPVKVVPFFLGELAHWGEDLSGNDLQRAYLHTGVRASIPMWAVNPNVKDPLFNLNGLAHKVVFDVEASYADSNRDVTQLPLYDEIEDNALEDIRRRIFTTPIPAMQDPRFYLVRSGIQGVVASPTTELADDLTVARVGVRQRLQTKRGAPGQERVIDWLTFDTNASFFPEPSRDNFGNNIGLVDYDMQWHVGDRFTILSDGFVDFFSDGLQTFSGGVALNRPGRGNAFIGYRTIRGPFDSDLLILNANYRLGPKWIASGSAVFDFGPEGNIGQNLALTRIGESLNVSIGINNDVSKDNVGFSFLIEPRFFPDSVLTRKTGIDIPPAGAEGLE